jgi:hypothetical protein
MEIMFVLCSLHIRRRKHLEDFAVCLLCGSNLRLYICRELLQESQQFALVSTAFIWLFQFTADVSGTTASQERSQAAESITWQYHTVLWICLSNAMCSQTYGGPTTCTASEVGTRLSQKYDSCICVVYFVHVPAELFITIKQTYYTIYYKIKNQH